MNKKGFIDFDEINPVGILMGVIAGIVSFIVMRNVPEVGMFWKILGFMLSGIIGYFASSKILGE